MLKQILNRMKSVGVRQSELADQIGVPRSTLHAWLHNTRQMPDNRIKQIVKHLGGRFVEARIEWRKRKGKSK